MTSNSVLARRMMRRLAVANVAAVLSLATFVVQAQQGGVTIKAADPAEQGDGTLSESAKAAMDHGPLPFSNADVDAKAAANRAREAAEKSLNPRPLSPAEIAPTGRAGAGPSAPVIVGGFNQAGQSGSTGTPPDTTGAIGPSSYIQLVNSTAGIYNRYTGALTGTGTLDDLAGVAASQNSFDPQIIWDQGTSRFYYVMDSDLSTTDNRLSFGFSRTPHPSNVTTDWCHYQLSFGARFPDFPKLGDSGHFIIIGVNSFQNHVTFVGTDLIAISKPPGGAGPCPAQSSFKMGTKLNLVDSANNQVFTAVPANQIDWSGTGYVVARNGRLPSTKLWFFRVTRDGNGRPVFGSGRAVTVGSYGVPAAASQPTFTQVLDTSDSRPTQAVQASDPRLGTYSFYTQHTIASGAASAVRWYEIDPLQATPVVLQSGDIGSPGIFAFNAAISPDRRVKMGQASAYGNSFVIEYSMSSKQYNVYPSVIAASSVYGSALSFIEIVAGVGGYRDFHCQNPGDTCRWGDYSSASPDPNAPLPSRGAVWGTNQFSGLANPPPTGVNWTTQIFRLQP